MTRYAAAANIGGEWDCMRHLEFSDSLRIDGGRIDAQHEALFGLINAMAAAIAAREIDRCKELSRAFLAAARDHFAWEEGFLREAGYPHVNQHAVYHRDLVALAEEAQRACDALDHHFDHDACFERLVSVFVEDVVKGDLTFKSFLDERRHKGTA